MIGLLVGAALGFAKGGPVGMIFGAVVGSWVATWISENILGNPSQKVRVQQAYFQALFTAIGKLAKVDGIVTNDEIRKCEIIMQKMHLDAQQRKLAIKYFNQGKAAGFNIEPVIDMFYRSSGRSYSIKQMFVEMLLEVASAGNKINIEEWDLLLAICKRLRFPRQFLITLARMRGFNIHGNFSYSGSSQHNSNQWRPPTQQKVNSYQVLGVSKSDSKAVIRKAYKKLMSSHHPDKLIAKGLPPEMVEIAKTKTQNIQAAWEDVKNMRGF
ncbi:DnaJ-like protein DjlA [hydrothermal vent metagenome]|uniref:DnaJ-like protein DjlA n=1 Tax=hydrothermal vent metagenome TaxID=652676 RepID=A0A3B0VPA9_9ZZZZ